MAATVLALHYVENDSPERLVLRAQRLGAYLGAAVLLVGGAATAVGAWWGYAGSSRMPMLLYFIGEGIGLLMLFGGGLLLWRGLTNKDRIVFDSQAREVRFEYTRWMGPTIPYDVVQRVVLREVFEQHSTRSPSGTSRSESVLLHRVELVRSDGENVVVDKASDAAGMVKLATILAERCGVPFANAD